MSGVLCSRVGHGIDDDPYAREWNGRISKKKVKPMSVVRFGVYLVSYEDTPIGKNDEGMWCDIENGEPKGDEQIAEAVKRRDAHATRNPKGLYMVKQIPEKKGPDNASNR